MSLSISIFLLNFSPWAPLSLLSAFLHMISNSPRYSNSKLILQCIRIYEYISHRLRNLRCEQWTKGRCFFTKPRVNKNLVRLALTKNLRVKILRKRQPMPQTKCGGVNSKDLSYARILVTGVIFNR